MEATSRTVQSAQNGLVGGLAISQLVGEEDHDRRGGAEETGLKRRLWVETKKLWHLVGPAILSRICSATFAVVTQAFAGHLGDVELASISIVNTVILGFSFGLLVFLINTHSLTLTSNSTLALDALLVCMNVNAWEMMIPISFFAAIGVRVANELGAGNGKGAKFATKVSVGQSLSIGILFSLLIILFHHKLAMIFSSSHDVIQAVGKLSYLLALTILFNSVQPVLSGVAVGSGWQSWVAYINIGCYYLIGIPVGLLLGRFFNFGVKGIWGGMIFGTAAQTTILAIITILCDWEKEAQKAVLRVKHLSNPNPDDDHLMVEN
ncbi:hypothetical protein RHSIM_Rhsim06G0075900 [Rhododendron simsii]|uniref:Uncharacterized protein n=1 Tax=Rhododendron simsii TaxID=118357 RepID=A0A834GQL4_RHOSS|nr:hypothetical protein RHSIM_Rhsim06G0075900 [Rhododendron simsii]